MSDRRPFVYAGLDVAFAILYVVIARKVAHSADGHFEMASYLLAGVALAAGIATAVRKPPAWWVAVAGCAVIATMAVVLIVLLFMSAAFLQGVYGSMGKAAASVCLAIAAISVEVYGLLPLFQLKYLLSADGRKAAGR